MNSTREQVAYALNWIVIAPVLMLSTTLYHSLITGGLLLLTLLLYCLFCALMRKVIIYNLRLPALIFLAATIATLIELCVQAWDYPLAVEFGIFLPLIAINGFLYSLSEEYFLRQNIMASLKTTMITGWVFFSVLCVLGVIRELLVYGSVFRGMNTIEFFISNDFNGLNLFREAPGALLCAGLILALCKYFDTRSHQAWEAL